MSEGEREVAREIIEREYLRRGEWMRMKKKHANK